MMIFSTYCSAAKSRDAELLPARERYLSDRICQVHAAADAVGADFRILSGRYGLLAASDAIPYYDHLLTREEVAGHAAKVERQLRPLEPGRVIFFLRPLAEDPDVEPYLATIQAACEMARISLALVEIPKHEQSASDLVALAREHLS